MAPRRPAPVAPSARVLYSPRRAQQGVYAVYQLLLLVDVELAAQAFCVRTGNVQSTADVSSRTRQNIEVRPQNRLRDRVGLTKGGNKGR